MITCVVLVVFIITLICIGKFLRYQHHKVAAERFAQKKRDYDKLTADLSSFLEYRLDSARNRCGTVRVNIGECRATSRDIRRRRKTKLTTGPSGV